jgi:two-component system chemotaxis sensor kinase CheA
MDSKGKKKMAKGKSKSGGASSGKSGDRKGSGKRKTTDARAIQQPEVATPAPPSGSGEITEKLDKVSEALVLADPSDYPALTEVLMGLEEVATLAVKSGFEQAATAASSSCKLIESIILEESPSPAATLDAVGRTIAALQGIFRDGRKPEEVELQIGLSPKAEEKPVEVSGLAAFKLPAHIDESIFTEFLSKQPGNLEDMETLVLQLEKNGDASKLGELKRLLHTLKGESALLGLSEIEHLCHTTEDMLGTVSPQQAIDALLGVRDWLGRAFEFLTGRADPPEPADTLLRSFEVREELKEEPEEQAEAVQALAKGPRYLEADPDLLNDFIIEARDHLDAADIHILTLETEPEESEALNAVFRAFHTIKGVAGFLALDEIGSLAHEAESLLDKARKGDLKLVGEAIDSTFDAVDSLKKLVGYVSRSLSTGAPLDTDPNLPALLRRIRGVSEGKAPVEAVRPAARAIDQPVPKLGQILVDGGQASMGDVESALERQKHPPEKKKLGEILVDTAVASRKKIESVLEEQRTDPQKRKIGELLVEDGSISVVELEAALEKQQVEPAPERLGEILVKESDVSAKAVAQALRSQKPGSTAVQMKETLKVDADRLDRLVDTIGELVIAESMVSQSEEIRGITSPGFMRHLRQLDKITRELQEMGTSLRMIPVRSTFQKMARLVRDLSKKSDKLVDFRMSGEDTELDKTVVDRIGDPLVHMVRNAIDHGIESDPEVRVKAGKPRMGMVELRAFHKGGSIFIEIEDDGKGLDRDLIVKKAIERGLIKSDEGMTEREVFNLIFEPGFSTAKTVTDVSGRGVGMDVVRRNIDALRGQVEIRSEPGKGSIFTLRLPLTLAIIDGMVVRVGVERYIIPTLSVVRSIQPQKRDLTTVFGRGEMLTVQGELIPLFRLSRLFRIDGAEEDPTKALVVVVEDDGKHAGLVTDELLGQQQIVIKSLGEAMRNAPGLAGGAIMPDGKVGLILDVGGLVRLAHSRDNLAAIEDGETAKKEGSPAGGSPLGNGKEE